MDEVFRGIGIMTTAFICCCVYFIPTMVAARRKKAWWPIGLLNFLLGWTIGGWVVALVWALTKDCCCKNQKQN